MNNHVNTNEYIIASYTLVEYVVQAHVGFMDLIEFSFHRNRPFRYVKTDEFEGITFIEGLNATYCEFCTVRLVFANLG